MQAEIEMTRAWVLPAAWVGAMLLLALWTVVSYANASNPDLQQEVLVRHSLLMILLSFPLGGLVALVVAEVVYVLGLQLAGIQDAWLTSMACLIAGCLQWFRLVPWLRRRWKSTHRTSSGT